MFKIVYHRLVIREDISKISKEWQNKIKKAIEERLMVQPDYYGRPLRRSLSGYRKLRVGNYRVIFKIEQNIVKILLIKHRLVVYKKINKRVK